jgi:hypothetical protein
MVTRKLTTRVSVLFLAVSLVACGGGGGSATDGSAGTAPTISALSFSPDAAYVDTDSDELAVVGTLDYVDPDGDIESLTIVVADESGQIIDDFTMPILEIAGSTSGTIQGELVADASVAGIYTVQVYITDSRDHRSNRLEDTFRIAEFPWAAKQPMLLPRRDFATAMLDGRIYVIGGGDVMAGVIPAPPTTTVEVYDPAAESWTSLAPLSGPRRNLAAEVVGGELFALGGYTGTFTLDAGYRRVVEVYDPVGNAWTMAEDMPIPRADFASAPIATQLIVAGGGNWVQALTDVSSLDAASGTWQMRTPMPTALAWPRGEAVAGKLYVFDTDATYEYAPGNDIL